MHRRFNINFFSLFLVLFLFGFFYLPKTGEAATLSLTPSFGSYSIGSTFDVSIILDTQGESVNALQVDLAFPPDMLQIVSPSTGQSIIGIWTATPKFDNKNGTMELQGGIPGGITAKNALVSTVTFRVKAVGTATVRFLDQSKVLLNDGLGTNVLSQTKNGEYKFKLPPPEGPIVTSETNPDQAVWYKNRTVSLRFANEGRVEGYSYILSDDPGSIPDNISEGDKGYISYTNLTDGVHYFHVKSLRSGVWGGVTHFSFKIDATPPAEFKIDIAPSARTTSRQPIFQFPTTDTLSGLDHYEVKIISLSLGQSGDANGLFVEAVSPYAPSALELGNYDVVVRVYDKAGNFREVSQRLSIKTPFFSFVSSAGINLGWSISWVWVWVLFLAMLGGLIFTAYRVRLWKHHLTATIKEKELPDNIAAQLAELKKYREKYGVKALMAILVISSLFSFANSIKAQVAEIAPPLITTISGNISNEEIFYAGGKTDFSNEHVVLYLQNLQTGETFSQSVESDNKGDWFYRHTAFLSPGNYLLWAQGKIGEQLSPPGPQVKMAVNRTAVQFGGGRLSYEAIYLLIIIIMSVCILGMVVYIFFHLYHGRKKHLQLQVDIKAAEESIARGFAVLKRDIEAELSFISKLRFSAALSADKKMKEAQLLEDLETVEQRLGKEIWEISKEA